MKLTDEQHCELRAHIMNAQCRADAWANAQKFIHRLDPATPKAEAIRSLEEAIKVNFMDLRNQIHESLGGIESALCTRECVDWYNHTCGECGWAKTWTSGDVSGFKYFQCRHNGWQCGNGHYASTPACPAFVERPKEEHTDD